MKAIINSLLIVLLLASLTSIAQVTPPEPPVPPSPTSPPVPPVVSEMDHKSNYKITLQSSDSESGESIYLSLKNKPERYLANGKFPNRFFNDIKSYLVDELGKYTNQSSNTLQWVGGKEEDAVYKVTLKDKSVLISLDRTIASSTLLKKIGDLGIGIKHILEEEDEEAEIERLERDADRLRRDAQRMLREAERIRVQSQRDMDRAERSTQQAQRDVERLIRQAERDASRVEREAYLLERQAGIAAKLTAHKGGMDSFAREVLRMPSTKYDMYQAQNRNNWMWPAFQQDLILSLEGDKLVGEDNELVFISDASGIYVNGNKMPNEIENAYRDLFKRHGFDAFEYFTFYKLYDHIAVTNDGVQLEALLKDLIKNKFISNLKEPFVMQINGTGVVKDGTELSVNDVNMINKLLSKYHIIPVPGKIVEISKEGNFIVGYRPDKKSVLGTWVMN